MSFKSKLKKVGKKIAHNKVTNVVVKKPIQVAHKITHNKAFEAAHAKVQKWVGKNIPVFKPFITVGVKTNALIHKGMDKTVLDKRRGNAAKILDKKIAQGGKLGKQAAAVKSTIVALRDMQAGKPEAALKIAAAIDRKMGAAAGPPIATFTKSLALPNLALSTASAAYTVIAPDGKRYSVPASQVR